MDRRCSVSSRKEDKDNAKKAAKQAAKVEKNWESADRKPSPA